MILVNHQYHTVYYHTALLVVHLLTFSSFSEKYIFFTAKYHSFSTALAKKYQPAVHDYFPEMKLLTHSLMTFTTFFEDLFILLSVDKARDIVASSSVRMSIRPSVCMYVICNTFTVSQQAYLK